MSRSSAAGVTATVSGVLPENGLIVDKEHPLKERKIGRSTRRVKLIWHSVVYITERWPVVVFGPMRMKKFGNSEMQVP